MSDNKLDLISSRESLMDCLSMSEAALRLIENPDFRKVVVDNYLNDYPLALLRNSAAVRGDSAQRNQLLEEARACVYFREYIDSVISSSENCHEEIRKIDEELSKYE